MKLFFIRTQGGLLLPRFLKDNIIAMGYDKIGDFSRYKNKDSVMSALIKAYPNFSEREISNGIGNIIRFSNDIIINDYVITFDNIFKCYHVGKVLSFNIFDKKYPNYQNVRKTLWFSKIPKKYLTIQAVYKLGGLTPVYKVDELAENEIFKKLKLL